MLNNSNEIRELSSLEIEAISGASTCTLLVCAGAKIGPIPVGGCEYESQSPCQ